MNDETVDQENQEINQADQEINQADQETSAITLVEFNEFNQNYVIGTLGIITALGFVFGALLGSVYGNIFK